MAFDLKEILTEEIALEGLDGINISALFLRLEERKGFTFSLDDSSKPYIWQCVQTLKNVEFYELEKPRGDLVLYNRFEYIDPETRHFLDTDVVPDSIYPVKVLKEEGVLGSCADYFTRKNITQHIQSEKYTLSQVQEKYGNSLTVVADQQTRLRTLMGDNTDPNLYFKEEVFVILELIGRARYNGMASYGKSSLDQLKESNKTLHYYLKKLGRHNVVSKQRLVLIKKPSNHKTTCFLYHLHRYFKEVGCRQTQEIIMLATYLSEKPEYMEEVQKVKFDLKIFDLFKKNTQTTSRSGKRYFDFVDVPYREKFPNAKPREYLQKNHVSERKIRHLRLLMPLDEVLKCLKERDVESDHEDEVDDEADDNDDVSPVTKIEYIRVLDQPQAYQAMQLINAAGSKGISMVQMKKIMNSHRLIIRRLTKQLQKLGFITSIMEDRGRQKVVMYIANEFVGDNKIHKTVNERMKQLQTFVITPKKETIKGRKGVPSKEVPVIKFMDEKPSEEKVSEIIEELDKLADGPVPTVSEKCLQQRKEYLLQKKDESGVKVEVNEITPEESIEKKSGKVMKGLKRFGALLTESHVRRANWIVEVVTAIKVIVSYRMLKLLRNREKEMNLNILMDNKSLKRLTNALCEEGKLRLYKAIITMGEKTKELLYLCDVSIATNEDEILLRKVEEAKLLNFSVSKEELKNLNIRKSVKDKLEKENKDHIDFPQSAVDTIQNHQLYRNKLRAKMVPMTFDRHAGKRYGLLPKMLRIRAVHRYLIYLCYVTHGHQLKTEGSTGVSMLLNESTIDDPFHVEGDKAMTSEETEIEPVIYVDELSWRRYLSPIPVHSGYPKGWCLISDCLLIMPVYFFCQIVNVCYQIEGLQDILNHPVKRYYPIMSLPFKLTQQLLHAKKYIQTFLHVCAYLAEMGLLSYGREMLKEKEQTFVYVHHNATLHDTRTSLIGYNKVTRPTEEPFPVKMFDVGNLEGHEEFWEFLQIVTLNSSLGMKTYIQRDLDDDVIYGTKSIKEINHAYTPDTIQDIGLLPGDCRGGAGLDSSLFSHAVKNWSNSSTSNACKEKYINMHKNPKDEHNIEGKREVVDNFNQNRIKGQDRMVLSGTSGKAVALKKVKRENLKNNKGGKGQVRSRTTKVTKTHRVLHNQEGKLIKRRFIKFPPFKHTLTTKRTKKGDAIDKQIYKNRSKLRVVFSPKEDSVVLMCWIANLIMDDKNAKVSLISHVNIRDYLHSKCGALSADKTSIAIQRRIKFVLRNPLTETNLLMFYREAMQDEYVLKNFVSKEFYKKTDEDLVDNFTKLVDYLLEKFKSLDFKRCSLPENLPDLRENYTLQYVGKLKTKKVFKDVTNKADICRDVLRNILHSAVVLQDKMGRTHEMFKLLSQYPDALLRQVIKELRNDGLLVINKKNYQNESLQQLQTGMGLRNFKVSQRYLYAFKHRYLSVMFDECAALFTKLYDNRRHGNDTDNMYTLPFVATGGEFAALLPLLLHDWLDVSITMPQELVIVDMEGFHNFPWGRGKGATHNTKGDKALQGFKSVGKDNTTNSNGKNKYMDDSDDDIDMEMKQTMKADNKEEEKKIKSDTSQISDAKKSILNEEAKQGTSTSSENVENNDEKIENVSNLDNNEVNVDEVISDETQCANEEIGTAKDLTVVTSKHCNIIIPTADPIPEFNTETGLVSAIASRTLISLRRSEDYTFDDLRIFNAQDNFVVNSCEIGVKITDDIKDEDNDTNDEVVEADVNKVIEKSDASIKCLVDNDTSNQMETDQSISLEGDMDCDRLQKKRFSSLLIGKDKIHRILDEMQQLLPFSIDVDQVWKDIASSGINENIQSSCKQLYQLIDSYGDVGVRIYDLKAEFADKIVTNEALQILLDQKMILKVGVSCIRYVSLRNARPWVIHAFRNIKGRGLHVDEENFYNAPIAKDEPSIKDFGISYRKSNFIYEEHHGTKTNEKSDKVGPSKKTVDETDVQATDNTGDSNEQSDETSGNTRKNQETDEVKKNDKSRKRVLADDHDVEITEKVTVIENDSEVADGDIDKPTNAKKRKLIDTNNEAERDELKSGSNLDADMTASEKLTADNADDKESHDSHADNCAITEVDHENKKTCDANKSEKENSSEKGITDSSKRVKKRKKVDTDDENVVQNEPPPVSTYDKVRLVIQPWRKPEGGINRDILKMMMESVMLFLMMNPGCPETELNKRYSPYIQPVVLRNLVDILEDIGAVTKQFIKKQTVSLFSKPTIPQIGSHETEDCAVCILPSENCVVKMGLFGQVAFPNAKWPETCYPGMMETRSKTYANREADKSTVGQDMPTGTDEQDFFVGDQGASTSEQDIPAWEQDIPVSEQDIPVIELDIPGSELDIPGSEQSISISEQDIPVSGQDIPVSEQSISTSEQDNSVGEQGISSS
ncbi:General transcription factor 3C polypeptide 1 [Mactra antiquata]